MPKVCCQGCGKDMEVPADRKGYLYCRGCVGMAVNGAPPAFIDRSPHEDDYGENSGPECAGEAKEALLSIAEVAPGAARRGRLGAVIPSSMSHQDPSDAFSFKEEEGDNGQG